MDCKEVSRFLQVYIDEELDSHDRSVFEEHLSRCLSCRLMIDGEKRFRQSIRARIPRLVASQELRTRLTERMGKLIRSGSVPRRLAWTSVPAVALLIVVISFTWTMTSGFSPLVEESVLQHASVLPSDMSSSDSNEIEGWFREKVDFNVTLPRFNGQRLSLTGARLSNLARRKAAMVRYKQGSHRFSFFVVTDPGGSLGSRQCTKIRNREFCLSEVKGFTVVLWRARGLVYSFVGDSDPPQMLDVLSTAFSY